MPYLAKTPNLCILFKRHGTREQDPRAYSLSRRGNDVVSPHGVFIWGLTMTKAQRVPAIVSCRYHSHQIRFIEYDHGDFQFPPKDAWRAIGIGDRLSALKDLNEPNHLDAGSIRFLMIPCPGGVDETVCINLYGLKSPVFRFGKAHTGQSELSSARVKEKLLPFEKSGLKASTPFEPGKREISPTGGPSHAVNVLRSEEVAL